MKKKREKIDSVEKLAILVADGFVTMEENFADVDKRFNDVDKRFDAVDKRFDVMESRFGRVETDIQEIRRILDRMDTRLAALGLAVFGATKSGGGKISEQSILGRLNKLERAVFRT